MAHFTSGKWIFSKNKNNIRMKSRSGLFVRILQHQWKEAVRSSFWQKSLLINVILGIFLLYFLVNLLVLGFFLGKILLSVFPDSDPVIAFSGIVFYYFTADFLLRFFMQSTPVISIVPYLHLPVKKTSVFHFLLIRSGCSLFNLFPVVVLLPFTLRFVIPAYSAAAGLYWLIALILIIFTNNYLAFFFKKLFALKPAVIFLVTAVTGIIMAIDITRNRVVSIGFGDGLMYLAQHPAWLLAPAFILIFSYRLSWFLLHRQRYMEVKEKNEKQYYTTERSRYFSELFGLTGTLVLLEIKMILRNNRPRSYLVLSFLFLFYGFMIYPRHPLDSGYAMILFIGLLLTGIMMVQYGQLVLSWESSYFDRLCTAGFSSRELFTAKYGLFFLFNTVTFLLTLPYGLFDYRIALVNFAAWLFNCGINSILILFLGTYNTKRIDMNKGAFFNYEGVSATHFFLVLPVLGLPVLISWMVALFTTPGSGIFSIGLIGFTGIIFHRQLIEIVTRQFISRKQKILHGFRNG
jgi:hypothetical protein